MTSMTPSDTRNRLAELLEAGIGATDALRVQLTAERQALEAQDSAALELAAGAKSHCLQTLEQLEQDRLAFLSDCGFSNDNNGMQALCKSVDNTDKLAVTWQRYQALARDCQQANMTNGAILRLRHQQIAAALAALSGRRAETYGPAGTASGGGCRALAEA
ncbi:MAG: flagellar protein FlgN [Woeseia sp.]